MIPLACPQGPRNCLCHNLPCHHLQVQQVCAADKTDHSSLRPHPSLPLQLAHPPALFQATPLSFSFSLGPPLSALMPLLPSVCLLVLSVSIPSQALTPLPSPSKSLYTRSVAWHNYLGVHLGIGPPKVPPICTIFITHASRACFTRLPRQRCRACSSSSERQLSHSHDLGASNPHYHRWRGGHHHGPTPPHSRHMGLAHLDPLPGPALLCCLGKVQGLLTCSPDPRGQLLLTASGGKG